MALYSEQELEQAALEWFQELGYETQYGPELSPEGDYPERKDYSQVVLEERLREALSRINFTLPPEAIEEAVRKITVPQSPHLLINNQAFHQMLTDGIDVQIKREDGSYKTEKVWPIDFKAPENNDWLVLNQFTVIENGVEKRPDLVVFVNGMPLVVIELKNASDEEADITKAYNQIQTYKKTIPSLFVYNAFSVISDGINARVGSLTADEDRFMMWRTIDGKELAPEGIPQLEVLLKGMMEKERFLDLLRYFILFQTDGENIYKILAAYHQYHAANKAIDRTIEATAEEGDRKIGVIWHTQGSGKSLSMVFYTGKLVHALDNPTVVVITDRNDLDDQLFSTFSRSKQLLRQTPKQARSRKELRDLLSVESGGIIFTTIQKFSPDEEEDRMPVLTDRRNVVVIADEAHRTQYGFEAKVSQGDDKARVRFGYAKYLRDALPNASFIGFTGTPVELVDRNTPAVFGDYIDIYDMTQAVEDGATVKIYYESRVVKLNLPEEEKEKLDREYEEITEHQELEEREKLKAKWARIEALAGAEHRLEEIARDFVEHFEKRQQAIFGKAMIVTMSRRIAVDLYDQIVKLRPDWHSDDIEKGVIKVVMTGNSSDNEKLRAHHTTKAQRELLAKRMRDPGDELKIVIVRDMWLTGFDVPCMHTIYIDKPMQGHNLMQAIARVNRVFRDKPGGLVVDYIGIADSLKRALNHYSASDRKITGIDTQMAVDIMHEKYDLILDLLHGHDYRKFLHGSASERMQAIVETVDYVLGLGEEKKRQFLQWVTELSKAYALCATTPEAERLSVEVGFFKSVKAGIVKMIPATGNKRTASQLDAEIKQLISKSVISEGVVDILDAMGIEKPNIAILSDEFLEEVRGLKHKNLAVELLNRLIKGKVKSMSRRNLVQSRKFSEMLEEAIIRYRNKAIESTQVIFELIELAKEMNRAHQRGEAEGLSEEELAFYDALANNRSAKEILGDQVLKQIARDLTDAIKKNMTIDWNLRESVRAKMRVMVKKLLRKYGYPPDQQKKAVETVMEQAELMCRNEAERLDEGEF